MKNKIVTCLVVMVMAQTSHSALAIKPQQGLEGLKAQQLSLGQTAAAAATQKKIDALKNPSPSGASGFEKTTPSFESRTKKPSPKEGLKEGLKNFFKNLCAEKGQTPSPMPQGAQASPQPQTDSSRLLKEMVKHLKPVGRDANTSPKNLPSAVPVATRTPQAGADDGPLASKPDNLFERYLSVLPLHNPLGVSSDELDPLFARPGALYQKIVDEILSFEEIFLKALLQVAEEDAEHVQKKESNQYKEVLIPFFSGFMRQGNYEHINDYLNETGFFKIMVSSLFSGGEEGEEEFKLSVIMGCINGRSMLFEPLANYERLQAEKQQTEKRLMASLCSFGADQGDAFFLRIP
jgi:hypothetical protein